MSLNSQPEEVLDLSTNQRLDIILQKYKEIFESNLKSIKNRKARLTLKKRYSFNFSETSYNSIQITTASRERN